MNVSQAQRTVDPVHISTPFRKPRRDCSCVATPSNHPFSARRRRLCSHVVRTKRAATCTRVLATAISSHACRALRFSRPAPIRDLARAWVRLRTSAISLHELNAARLPLTDRPDAPRLSSTPRMRPRISDCPCASCLHHARASATANCRQTCTIDRSSLALTTASCHVKNAFRGPIWRIHSAMTCRSRAMLVLRSRA